VLVHNTGRLSPAHFKDNPILALAPPYSAYWLAMDGRSLAEIHWHVGKAIGQIVQPAYLAAFCRHLEECGLIQPVELGADR